LFPTNYYRGKILKRFLTSAVLLFFVTMPCTSLARVAISDNDLAAVTAQQGVSIAFNDVTISATSLSVLSWGDSDGFTGYPNPGYAGLANIALTSGNTAVINGVMLVDVGTNGGTTGVNITLPRFIFGGAGSNLIATVKTGTTKDIISSYSTNITVTNLAISVGGTVKVFAHTTP
jgi:hypothetical protein